MRRHAGGVKVRADLGQISDLANLSPDYRRQASVTGLQDCRRSRSSDLGVSKTVIFETRSQTTGPDRPTPARPSNRRLGCNERQLLSPAEKCAKSSNLNFLHTFQPATEVVARYSLQASVGALQPRQAPARTAGAKDKFLIKI